MGFYKISLMFFGIIADGLQIAVSSESSRENHPQLAVPHPYIFSQTNGGSYVTDDSNAHRIRMRYCRMCLQFKQSLPCHRYNNR